jgi:antitoxin (DNA-binding transcriptional repressor) of toxin-antitoxin stability system
MRAVGLKALKNRLGEYVRLAAGGETVLVTDRDRIVAEIVPPRAAGCSTVSDALLAEAMRNGWVSPPVMRREGAPPRKPVCSWQDLYSELTDSREGR